MRTKWRTSGPLEILPRHLLAAKLFRALLALTTQEPIGPHSTPGQSQSERDSLGPTYQREPAPKQFLFLYRPGGKADTRDGSEAQDVAHDQAPTARGRGFSRLSSGRKT